VHVESSSVVFRPRDEVFAFLARAERLPDYVQEFENVRPVTPHAQPGHGTQYHYRIRRGGAEGTFAWTEFAPPERLAWAGPPVKSGPGSMKPSGHWHLEDAQGGGTKVTLAMTPEPGGLFKVLAPLMSRSMRKGNARALERLKAHLEGA
jgi:uncharacterized protein YndB with AHSA1/START domain